MARVRDEIIREITEDYLEKINPSNPPSPKQIQEDLLLLIQNQFELENVTRAKGNKLQLPQKLSASQIADIILRVHPVACISCAGTAADRSYDLLAIYQTSGDNEGIYLSDDYAINAIIRSYCYTIPTKEIEEVKAVLKDTAPRKTREDARNLIAVNNGIFDFDTKRLLPFSKDHVFIAKSHVDYNPNAVNVTIYNPMDGTNWNVEEWMAELFENEDMRECVWQVIGAIIRPNVRWGKSAWFYSNTGNNGKGTLCELMRCICGEETYASISLSDFSKEFTLEPLIHASAVIVDENDVGMYLDKAANLKAVITNDVIQVNRKFKTPIAFQFRGFMVQCLNEYPKIRDRSDSFYRRQLFIPFEKSFTGHERKYIKDDYLHRKEVLEYVLFKVLNMDYYTIDVPQACEDALEEYKEFNDPVRQFIDEIFPELAWDVVPFRFLYDLYKVWFKQNIPNGIIQGRNVFIEDIVSVLPNVKGWYCPGKKTARRPGNRMDEPEPLIAQYNLDDWKDPYYRGSDPKKIGRPPIPATTRGIMRISVPVSDKNENI